MTNGERIKYFREQQGLTQTELADYVGTTKQTIFKYENGIVTNIPSDKIEKISAALHITPADIFGWKASPSVVLTTEEKDLINAYRAASPDTRLAVRNVLGIKNDYIESSDVG